MTTAYACQRTPDYVARAEARQPITGRRAGADAVLRTERYARGAQAGSSVLAAWRPSCCQRAMQIDASQACAGSHHGGAARAGPDVIRACHKDGADPRGGPLPVRQLHARDAAAAVFAREGRRRRRRPWHGAVMAGEARLACSPQWRRGPRATAARGGHRSDRRYTGYSSARGLCSRSMQARCRRRFGACSAWGDVRC